MKEIFHTNPLKIIDCIDMESLYYGINDFLIFEKFLIHYFDENELQVVKTMHKIIFKAYNQFSTFNFLMILSSLDDFKKFLNLIISSFKILLR